MFDHAPSVVYLNNVFTRRINRDVRCDGFLVCAVFRLDYCRPSVSGKVCRCFIMKRFQWVVDNVADLLRTKEGVTIYIDRVVKTHEH